MPKKVRSQSCSSRWCRNHEFCLQALDIGLHIRKQIRMRMCPQFSSNLNKFVKGVPVLNKDNRFYTPTFILEDQQKFYQENTQRFLIKHLEKAQQNESGKSQILVPKQSANKNFCSICQQTFQDYLSHIETKKHRSSVHRTPASAYILDLQQKYKKLRRRESKEQKPIGEFMGEEESNQLLMLKQEQPKRSEPMTKNQCHSELAIYLN